MLNLSINEHFAVKKYHSKITFLKKGSKKHQYALKESLLHKKRTFTQVLIWQYKMKLQQNYFCIKKDKKFIFPTKVVISKNCANCKNG